MITYDNLKEKWKTFALENCFKFLLIVKDLEDTDIFPVYFNTEIEANKYCNNIISESKLKVLEKINIF